MARRHALLIAMTIAAAPVRASVTPAPPSASPATSKACVPVDQIAGAIVTDDQNVELRLKDGSAWQMRFAEPCPALGYYQGFYYRRARAGFLCAGHDTVIARSGGACPIVGLSRTVKPRRR